MRRSLRVVLWLLALSAWAADLWFIRFLNEFLPWQQQTGGLTVKFNLYPWRDIGAPLVVAGIVVGVLFAWAAQRLTLLAPRWPGDPGLRVPVSETVKRAVPVLLGAGAWMGFFWVVLAQGPMHADVRGATSCVVIVLALTITVLLTKVATRISDRLHFRDPMNRHASARFARYQARECRRQAKADRRLYG